MSCCKILLLAPYISRIPYLPDEGLDATPETLVFLSTARGGLHSTADLRPNNFEKTNQNL